MRRLHFFSGWRATFLASISTTGGFKRSIQEIQEARSLIIYRDEKKAYRKVVCISRSSFRPSHAISEGGVLRIL